VTLTFDRKHLYYTVCTVVKLCTKFERNRAIRGGVIAISIFDLMTLICVTCCARLWKNFHQVLTRSTYPFLTYIVMLLIRYVTLWPWPLTPWPWTITADRMSRKRTLYRIWVKLNNHRLSYWRFSIFQEMRTSKLYCAEAGEEWIKLHQTLERTGARFSKNLRTNLGKT